MGTSGPGCLYCTATRCFTPKGLCTMMWGRFHLILGTYGAQLHKMSKVGFLFVTFEQSIKIHRCDLSSSASQKKNSCGVGFITIHQTYRAQLQEMSKFGHTKKFTFLTAGQKIGVRATPPNMHLEIITWCRVHHDPSNPGVSMNILWMLAAKEVTSISQH